MAGSPRVPTSLVNLDLARERYGDFVDDYAHYFFCGDALADDLTEVFHRIGARRGFELLDRALAHGLASVPDAPPALIALMRQVERVPEWVDWQRIALGARTFQRTGIGANVVLSAVSLMVAYRSSVANKPLVFTKALEKMAARRLAETGRFVVAACQADGLRRDAPGFRMAVRVRMMHAKVRFMLQRSPRWDLPAWGVPINQANMCGTALLFSFALIRGLRKLGFRISRDEGDALVHLWRYAGWLSGVEEPLLFDREADAELIYDVGMMVQPTADADSRALAGALSSVPAQHARNAIELAIGTGMARYIDGMTRALNGDELADDLGVQHARWRHALPLTRAVVAPLEVARRVVPGGTRAAAYFGNRLMHRGIRIQLKGRDARFAPPTELPAAAPPSGGKVPSAA